MYDPAILENVREEVVRNKYGEAKVAYGSYHGMEVAFLARHGAGHSVPPHLINYRANIRALRDLGVERIIATAAVGSLNLDMRPGDVVLVDQFLDFTRGRAATFFDGGDTGVIHCDVTVPYCQEVGEVLARVGTELELKIHRGGVYVCTEGPRFETAAEVRMYKQLGGDVIGMTGVPECVLAREAGICYASVATVTNYAAGISSAKLTHTEVLEIMAVNAQNVRKMLMGSLGLFEAARGCGCDDILEEIRKLRELGKG